MRAPALLIFLIFIMLGKNKPSLAAFVFERRDFPHLLLRFKENIKVRVNLRFFFCFFVLDDLKLSN